MSAGSLNEGGTVFRMFWYGFLFSFRIGVLANRE